MGTCQVSIKFFWYVLVCREYVKDESSFFQKISFLLEFPVSEIPSWQIYILLHTFCFLYLKLYRGTIAQCQMMTILIKKKMKVYSHDSGGYLKIMCEKKHPWLYNFTHLKFTYQKRKENQRSHFSLCPSFIFYITWTTIEGYRVYFPKQLASFPHCHTHSCVIVFQTTRFV